MRTYVATKKVLFYNINMKERYGELTKNILLGLAMTGAIAIAATSPYFLVNILKQISRNKKYFKKKLENWKIKRAFEKLKRNKLIILNEENGKFIVEITEQGKRKVKELQVDELKIEKPTVWDKKWRVVIFDIPNRNTRARNALRDKIRELKFYLLQKSVWVHPYPCEKEIKFLAELFNVSSYINIILAENIDNDVKLRKYFNLL